MWVRFEARTKGPTFVVSGPPGLNANLWRQSLVVPGQTRWLVERIPVFRSRPASARRLAPRARGGHITHISAVCLFLANKELADLESKGGERLREVVAVRGPAKRRIK